MYLSAATATVITALFYPWPPGIHTASPLLVLLYHHPQFCLSAGWGRGAEERERSKLGEEEVGGGLCTPGALTVAGDRWGPREKLPLAGTSGTLTVVSGDNPGGQCY